MSNRRFSLVVACWLSLAALVAASPAQEWTRFRGPNGSGISEAKGIPSQFSERGYNWKTELPLGGHSSPVLWGDKVFLTCADDAKSAQRMVVCLDAANGKILWSKEYDSSFHRKHLLNSFASSTPAADEKHVYVTWSTPQEVTLLALTHDGEEAWRRSLGPYVSQHSTGVSPIVYKDLVILGNDQDEVDKEDASQRGKSFLLAVHRDTGATQWQVDRKSVLVAYSTPCIYQPEGGPPEMIFNSQAHGVTSLNPLDGSLNWEIDAADGGPLLSMRSVSSPVLCDGLITASCGSGGGGNYLVAVRPGERGGKSPEFVYKVLQRDAAPYVPTPIYKDGLLFMVGDGGFAACFDAETGDKQWYERLGGNFYSSPVCIDGRLFCVNTDGEVVVLAAGDEFKLLGKSALGETCHSTPAVAGGKLYLRTYKHLISVGGKEEVGGR